jgi:hypothetical protein
LLDIERAFNKMEKVALTRRRKGSPPMVLIINSTHLVRDDHDGQDLLEMIQQRAEQWAASGLVTTSKSTRRVGLVLTDNVTNSPE